MSIREKINKLPLNTKAALIISAAVFIITMLLTFLLQLALRQGELAILYSLQTDFPNYVAARQDILDAFSFDRLDRYLALLPLFAFLNLFAVYFAVSALIKKFYGDYDDLIQNAAHEIKTPLFALKTSVEVLKLKDKPLINDYSNFANSVEVITTRLSRLIESLLVVTKNSNEFITNEVCNLSFLAKEIIRSFSSKIAAKKISLSTKIEDGIKYKIQQRFADTLFTNIIDNAVKYSGDLGNISINLKKENDKIIFMCKDDGIGIPKAELNKISQKFYRGSNASLSGEEGSGLGLSAVKKILYEYGGDITIKSDGKGVEVIFELLL